MGCREQVARAYQNSSSCESNIERTHSSSCCRKRPSVRRWTNAPSLLQCRTRICCWCGSSRARVFSRRDHVAPARLVRSMRRSFCSWMRSTTVPLVRDIMRTLVDAQGGVGAVARAWCSGCVSEMRRTNLRSCVKRQTSSTRVSPPDVTLLLKRGRVRLTSWDRVPCASAVERVLVVVELEAVAARAGEVEGAGGAMLRHSCKRGARRTFGWVTFTGSGKKVFASAAAAAMIRACRLLLRSCSSSHDAIIACCSCERCFHIWYRRSSLSLDLGDNNPRVSSSIASEATSIGYGKSEALPDHERSADARGRLPRTELDELPDGRLFRTACEKSMAGATGNAAAMDADEWASTG